MSKTRFAVAILCVSFLAGASKGVGADLGILPYVLLAVFWWISRKQA